MISALSLASLRRKIEDKLIGEQLDVRLVLGRRAREARDQFHRGGHGDTLQWGK
jgi:hypothetical protein